MTCLTCSKCRQTMPVERFSRDPSRKRGYRFLCKDCRKRQRADKERAPLEAEAHVSATWFAYQALLPASRGQLVARIVA